MTIEMIEITPEYMPEVEGKYLVRTVSHGPLKLVHWLQARVYKHFDEKKGEWKYSIDINHQKATHISKEIVI